MKYEVFNVCSRNSLSLSSVILTGSNLSRWSAYARAKTRNSVQRGMKVARWPRGNGIEIKLKLG